MSIKWLETNGRAPNEPLQAKFSLDTVLPDWPLTGWQTKLEHGPTKIDHVAPCADVWHLLFDIGPGVTYIETCFAHVTPSTRVPLRRKKHIAKPLRLTSVDAGD